MNTIRYEIIQTPSDHDSDGVRFFRGGKEIRGFGFVGKGDTKICLIRCPQCERENYGMAVSSGVCCWCGYNPNI